MYRDASNLFRVKFTATLDYDFTKAFGTFDAWYAGVQEKLKTDRIDETFQEMEVSNIRFRGKVSSKFNLMRFSGASTSAWFW